VDHTSLFCEIKLSTNKCNHGNFFIV